MDDKLRIDESIGEALGRAELGEQVTLHRNGRPIAQIVPADPEWDIEEAMEAVAEMERIRQGFDIGALRIKDLINAGRKY